MHTRLAACEQHGGCVPPPGPSRQAPPVRARGAFWGVRGGCSPPERKRNKLLETARNCSQRLAALLGICHWP
eukprot:15479614-Alexandrium_andersonii.AAC.1